MKYLGEMEDLTLVGVLPQVGINARSLASSCCIYESCVPQLEAQSDACKIFCIKKYLAVDLVAESKLYQLEPLLGEDKCTQWHLCFLRLTKKFLIRVKHKVC